MVPTTVDHRAYAERKPATQDKLTVGWIGSAATAPYLQTITPELEELCNSLPARLRLIGVERHNFKCADVVVREWSEDTEREELAACDIGLAPMYDGPWERGKCGFKAIQYMAMGIPVLAADVGVLPTIVRHGETGFIYRDGDEFTRYAHQLANEPDLRRRMGANGMRRVAERYSTQCWANTIADELIEAAHLNIGSPGSIVLTADSPLTLTANGSLGVKTKCERWSDASATSPQTQSTLKLTARR